MRTDPTDGEVEVLLDEIDASTARVAASLAALDRPYLSARRALPGWSRATIVAHLSWAGSAT